jgi:hypothetical protein
MAKTAMPEVIIQNNFNTKQGNHFTTNSLT